VRDVFDESCAKFGSRRAYTCMGKSITFAELDEQSRAFGAYLQGKGLKKGDRVALMMPNILQYPVCLFGILRAGCTVVNVNPLYTARELEHQLTDSGAQIIVVVENLMTTVAEAVGKSEVKQVIVTSIGEMLGLKGLLVDFVLRHVKKMIPTWSIPGTIRLSERWRKAAAERLNVALGHDDVAFLQYTGGTTGVAKGATLPGTGTSWPTCCSRRHGSTPFSATNSRSSTMPLPLYHIFR
jgi:long-chain acyl-CoA synthetase